MFRSMPHSSTGKIFLLSTTASVHTMKPLGVLVFSFIWTLLPSIVSSQAIAGSPESISITQAPGYKDQDTCAQNCIWGFGFAGVASFVGCKTNACLCRADHLYAGIQYISSCAVATCSNLNDATGGMSVFSAYCAGLGSTSVQTPTVLGSSAQTQAVDGGSTPTAGASVTPGGGEKTVLSLVTITPTLKDVSATITTTDRSGSPVTETVMTAIPVVTETNTQSQLSESDKIALGVGLGMGVPTFLITMWACWKMKPSSRKPVSSHSDHGHSPGL